MTTLKHQLEGNAVYFQSGGPTSVINTTFLGVYETFLSYSSNEKFYVSRYGISSLLENNLEEVKGDYSFLRLENGTHFGSLRKLLPEEEDAVIGKTIVDNLEKNNIRYVFINGGNDSMDTAYKVDRYCKYHHYKCYVIGLPKTIDNDLYGCDHTPGYGSAAKFVCNSLLAITYDEYSYKKGKILLVETMGRDSGYLAASSVLTAVRGKRPDYIYVPEVTFHIDSFLNKAIKTYQEKGHCIIVLSEGIKDENGNLISSKGKSDAFGNKVPGGVGNYLSSLISEKGYPSRCVEFNTLQRSASFMISKTDSDEAYEVGKKAFLSAYEQKTGMMVSLKRISSSPYVMEYPLIDLSLSRRKASSMPKEYINETEDNINDSFIEYVKPLVVGNVDSLKDDGLLA